MQQVHLLVNNNIFFIYASLLENYFDFLFSDQQSGQKYHNRFFKYGLEIDFYDKDEIYNSAYC